MICIACLTCGFCMRVEGTAEEDLHALVGEGSEYWPDKYACPECGGAARGLYPHQISSSASSKLRTIDLRPSEAFAALNGLGLPSERSCILEDVSSLMQTGVKRISGKNIRGTSRCVVDFIELSDGSRIYLGPSSEGATVYRVTRPHSYVKAFNE